MRKQTTGKKRAASKTRGKKAPPAVKKKKILKKPKKEKTVFTRIKNAFDETTAKLKTLLPGENRSNHREEGTEMA